MKYYCEETNKFYETEKECMKAEQDARAKREKILAAEKQKAEDRKAAAAKVEEARKTAIEANKAYRDTLTEFCKTYGSFHTSYKTSDIPSLFDLIFDF